MAGKSFKIIVDSNIWISFLIGKSLQGLQIYINSNLIRIVTCEEQLQELHEVFNKPINFFIHRLTLKSFNSLPIGKSIAECQNA